MATQKGAGKDTFSQSNSGLQSMPSKYFVDPKKPNWQTILQSDYNKHYDEKRRAKKGLKKRHPELKKRQFQWLANQMKQYPKIKDRKHLYRTFKIAKARKNNTRSMGRSSFQSMFGRNLR